MLTAPPRPPSHGVLPSFEVEFEGAQRRAVRTACLVASPLLLVFSALDLWVVPEAWVPLLGLRLGAAVVFLVLAALLGRGRISPRTALYAVVALVMAPITVGALYSGGTTSAYVYAAMLPMGGIALLVPLRPWEAGATCALVLLLLYGPLLSIGELADAQTFVTGASFLLCMGILTVAGAGIRQRVFRNEYDIRRRAAGQLGLANLGMLAGGLAHELANPLGVLGMAIDGLKRHGEYPAEAREDIELIVRATDRMQDILAAMRSHTRLGDRRFAPVDLADEIEAATLLLEERFRQAGITLRKDIDPAPPCDAERTLLGQVLLNLLINAADAVEGCPRPRWIAVRLRRDDGAAVIEVEDNGPGVAEEERDRIFAPLYTTKGESGTGLGLWLSAEIARAHEGSLTLHDGCEGGALFRLRIAGGAGEPPTDRASLAPASGSEPGRG